MTGSVDAVLAGCVDLSLFAALTGRVEPSQPYGLKRLAAHFGLDGSAKDGCPEPPGSLSRPCP